MTFKIFNLDFGVEIYYKKKMPQIKAFDGLFNIDIFQYTFNQKIVSNTFPYCLFPFSTTPNVKFGFKLFYFFRKHVSKN